MFEGLTCKSPLGPRFGEVGFRESNSRELRTQAELIEKSRSFDADLGVNPVCENRFCF
jgi:hypothetical protein